MRQWRPAGATVLACLLGPVALVGCTDAEGAMNRVAGAYVRLVLQVGLHDPDYVDAYYGPAAWREDAAAETLSLAEIRTRANGLAAELRGLPAGAGGRMLDLRRRYLLRQLQALRGRVQMLAGRRLPFDRESRLLFDAVAPRHAERDFADAIAALEQAIPGEGDLPARYGTWRDAFVIPPERLDTVFRTAIDACREQTRRRLDLPAGESFAVEYVTGQPWSAYNWYRGEFHSLIQVNTDLPIHIDRAVDLACHEGYPGHHVYNLLLERALVRGRGWIEFAVYPLFSPQSLIAEGSADYGVRLAFPGRERLDFEGTVLFPLAGLDSSRADEYHRVRGLVGRLKYAEVEAARRYLEGELDEVEALHWLGRYALLSPERARQRLRFIERYRSYVINYAVGEDLVQAYVEREGGADDAQRWRAFERLIATPGGLAVDP